MSKWKHFHSKYSPLTPGTINTGDANVPADWSRVDRGATIDNVPIQDYKKNYNNFKNANDVKNFFKDIILAKMNDNEAKEDAATYLLRSFHQGGLMFPVSAPLSEHLGSAAKIQPRDSSYTRQLRITRTEDGFKVQEIYSFKQAVVLPTAPKQVLNIADENGLINPDSGSEFVLEAAARIDVNFSNNSKEPDISIEANYISYGNDKVKSLLDRRKFIELIIDFIRNVVGINSVKDVSSSKEQTPVTNLPISEDDVEPSESSPGPR